jgi:hypothetical protein
MGHDVNSARDLFEKIVRKWGARPDPSEGLTLNQIAALVLGSGTSENASIIGRTIVDFHDYFYQADGGAYRWNVRWTRIEHDHPALFPRAEGTSSTIPDGGPVADMLHALQDEIEAVKQQSRDHPIKAIISRSLGQMPDGVFWYEAQLELPGDSELPVPEGVQIRLTWPYHLGVYPCEAKLLNYFSLKSTIIFEVEKPLGDTQIKNKFQVLPNIEQLIIAVKEQLGRAEQRKERAIWRLLFGSQIRKPIAWTGPLVRNLLDESQLAALGSCLGNDITYLWGPPGTGKTHTLGRLMASAALAGKRVIASAISNIAVDQMALQVVRALESAGDEGRLLLDQGRVIRFGYPRDPFVTAEPRLFPNKTRIQELRKALHELQQRLRDISETEAEARAALQHEILHVKSQLKNLTKLLIDESRIVLTTSVQICIEAAINTASFDLAVIDEASMMPIPYVLCVGALGSERVVITGDFRQLGPIALAQSAAAYRWLHKDPFELAGICGDVPKHPALAMLQVQRRMQSNICELINAPFYGGKLRTESKPQSATALGPLPGKPAVLVLFLQEDGSLVEQTPDGSRVNKLSAALVVELLCRYLDSDPQIIVGVIAPYRAEVTCIRRLVRDRSWSKDQAKRIRLGTVHAFQGSEADVIIWDLVESRHHKIGRLYLKDVGDRLTNVAISRAKGKLVLVGDPDAFFLAAGQESVGKLRSIMARHFHSNSSLVVAGRDFLAEVCSES